MKKSLMALAVLGALSGAASAQSSVTLYGIVDIGVQWNERRQPGAPPTGAGERLGHRRQLASSRLARFGSAGPNWNRLHP
jgi:predicted porin